MYTIEEIFERFFQWCAKFDAETPPGKPLPYFSLDIERQLEPHEMLWMRAKKLPGRYEGAYWSHVNNCLGFMFEHERVIDHNQTASAVPLIIKATAYKMSEDPIKALGRR